MINTDFLEDDLYQQSYNLGISTTFILDEEHRKYFWYDHWRVFIACYFAKQCSSLEGDFIECGTNTGFLARAILHYTGFEKLRKKFYLLDTFCGVPVSQFSSQERSLGLVESSAKYYRSDIFNEVQNTFRDFNNVFLVKGEVPSTLSCVPSESVAFLSIDMNCAYPELKAMEFFWDKLTPGAAVIFDDYGFSGNGEEYITQKETLDQFADSKKTRILTLPSGQGLLIKRTVDKKESTQDSRNVLFF